MHIENRPRCLFYGAALTLVLVFAVLLMRWWAPFPPVQAAGSLDDQWWAFQKPARPPVPEVDNPDWSGHPIDAFLYAELQERKLEPAPPADKATLIRRAYLDLVGLLPTPEEVDAFVADQSAQAYTDLIDRLLASPHYGERWGRHWLDVVRYGDSGGYEHDYDYPNAWRYRDYVVAAFNQDKPYDRFILEQLAGDELEPTSPEALIATGFNRVGATVGYREKDNPQYRYMYLDDMIATTSRAFMGLSVECARCHDHKFDPISQLDYYRMMAIFFPYVNYDHPLTSPREVASYEARKAEISSQIAPLKEKVREIEEPYRRSAFERKLLRYPADIQEAVRTPESERTPGQQLLAAQVLSTGPGPFADLISPADQSELEGLRSQIGELEKQLPEPLPVAMGIRDGDYRFAPDGAGDEIAPGKGEREVYDFEGHFLPLAGKPYQPPPAHLLPTGSHLQKGEVVQPGFLEVLTQGDPPTAVPVSKQTISSGRRLALAQWLASPGHPLTARVMVNRIWHHHFGRGLVETPNNFGYVSMPPSHPELLDWLANEFVQRGWSLKAMHRLLMTSRAYRMAASSHSPQNARTDPENHYLWRYPQRRLEAEILRDVILMASGKLNLEAGGEPFFPPVPESVYLSFPKGRWDKTAEGPAVWRRSIYSYWKRGLRYPFFEVFDLPNPNVSCEARVTTTVPTQALTLLNNEFVLLQAGHFAERILKSAGSSPSDQVTTAYRIALGREPRAAEMERNLEFLTQQTDFHRSRQSVEPELKALTDLCHVVLNLTEFAYIN